jgi:hypothetical protein
VNRWHLVIAIACLSIATSLASIAMSYRPDVGKSNGDLTACGAMLDYNDMTRGQLALEAAQICSEAPPVTAKAKRQWRKLQAISDGTAR